MRQEEGCQCSLGGSRHSLQEDGARGEKKKKTGTTVGAKFIDRVGWLELERLHLFYTSFHFGRRIDTRQEEKKDGLEVERERY